MSYDAWKCASPEEGVELEERWDDVTSVEECVHGEHPMECSLCTSAGLHAAVSGEGEDMEQDNPFSVTHEVFVEKQTTRELVSLRNAIELELRKRAEEHEREAKAARNALDGIKPRKTRSDAGTTRARKEVAA